MDADAESGAKHVSTVFAEFGETPIEELQGRCGGQRVAVTHLPERLAVKGECLVNAAQTIDLPVGFLALFAFDYGKVVPIDRGGPGGDGAGRALAPMLFDDDDPAAAEAARSSPVAPAQRSKAARAKAGRKRTPDGLPVHSFRSLLGDLATLTRNRVRPAVPGAMTADVLARPTPLQTKAFRLLGIRSMTRTQ